jgi:hypothetical protein
MKSYNDFKPEPINESSLSRLWRHNEEHDCGALTAFRVGRNCGEGESYTKKENNQRNKSLLAKLKSKGYGVTKLLGKYPEGGKSVTETSWFVVDLNDTGKLEADLKRLGEEFEQDSILYIPKGAIKIKGVTADLIGTNRCENNWLGYGKREKFAKGKLGYDSPIYTSYVNGRPFLFEGIGEEVKSPAGGMGVWYMHRLAEKNWQDIEID